MTQMIECADKDIERVIVTVIPYVQDGRKSMERVK